MLVAIKSPCVLQLGAGDGHLPLVALAGLGHQPLLDKKQHRVSLPRLKLRVQS